MEFNQCHGVGDVMKPIVLDDELRKKRANDIDLRFFTLICLGDTYNGNPNPLTGMRYSVILYGNQPVHSFSKGYQGGIGFAGQSEGSTLFAQMYDVAKAYLRIIDIGRRQFFDEKLQTNLTREEQLDANRVWVDSQTLRRLKKHPQYQDLVLSMGLRLIRVKGTMWRSVRATLRYKK